MERQHDDQFSRLLEQAIAGDPDAVPQLIEDLRPYLLLIANQDWDRDLHAKLAPSDLVQSALFAAHQNFSDFRGEDTDKLRAWVKQILHNAIVDARRRFKGSAKRNSARESPLDRGLQVAEGMADLQATPRRLSIRSEQAALLEQAMAELPESQRLAIRWRNWDEMGFREIGERLGMGEDGARKLWARALVRLHEVIQSKYPGLDAFNSIDSFAK